MESSKKILEIYSENHYDGENKEYDQRPIDRGSETKL
jgi:hypothetical protein